MRSAETISSRTVYSRQRLLVPLAATT
jgi:hypothetical protein